MHMRTKVDMKKFHSKSNLGSIYILLHVILSWGLDRGKHKKVSSNLDLYSFIWSFSFDF